MTAVRISTYMDARLERWAYHLLRQGNIATATWRRAGMPAPPQAEGDRFSLADAEFGETQAMLGALAAADRLLVEIWYTAADRREIVGRLSRSGPRGTACLLAWPWPRVAGQIAVVVVLSDQPCRCPACIRAPSYASLYSRLARIHRTLWRMLRERRAGGESGADTLLHEADAETGRLGSGAETWRRDGGPQTGRPVGLPRIGSQDGGSQAVCQDAGSQTARQHGSPPQVAPAPSVRIPGPERSGRGRTIAHVAPASVDPAPGVRRGSYEK